MFPFPITGWIPAEGSPLLPSAAKQGMLSHLISHAQPSVGHEGLGYMG